MYIEEMISIGRAENGYLVKIRVPEKEDGDERGMHECYPESYTEKTLVEKDVDSVVKMIGELLPKLQDKMEMDEMFSKTFKEIVKS